MVTSYMKDPHQREEEYLALYEECADSLFRHCYFRVSDRERALELAHEAFARTWEYVADGKEIANPKAFLFRTAHNLIIDHYRKKKESSLEALAEGGFDPSGDDHKQIELSAETREAVAAISNLEEDDREVVTLRYVSDLSIGEIATVRKESENAVSVRLHRAVKKLRDILEHGQT